MYILTGTLDRATQQLNTEIQDVAPRIDGPHQTWRIPAMLEMGETRNAYVTHWAEQDNPFFQLFEALWQLGGRNDVQYLAQFQDPGTIAKATLDHKTYEAQPGWRWQNTMIGAESQKYLHVGMIAAEMVRDQGRESLLPS